MRGARTRYLIRPGDLFAADESNLRRTRAYSITKREFEQLLSRDRILLGEQDAHAEVPYVLNEST